MVLRRVGLPSRLSARPTRSPWIDTALEDFGPEHRLWPPASSNPLARWTPPSSRSRASSSGSSWPNKGEARADNRLLPDERKVLRFPLPEGVDPAAVRVRLLWLPVPLLPLEQAFVLGEWPGSGQAANGGARRVGVVRPR
jgi:hypothetical protein